MARHWTGKQLLLPVVASWKETARQELAVILLSRSLSPRGEQELPWKYVIVSWKVLRKSNADSGFLLPSPCSTCATIGMPPNQKSVG